MAAPVNLYIPIEIKHRELYSKILLAAHAAPRGFNVFLGRKQEMNSLVTRMPPGVYYGLGTVKNFAPHFQELAGRGHRIVVSDEEGLITYTDEMYLDLKVASETLKSVDLLFAWGDEHARVLSTGRPEAAAKLRTTGNPRFDLLKPPYSGIYDSDIAAIRQRHPRFVLVCTSFGSCNHYIRDLDYIQELIDKKVLTTPESVEVYRRFQRIKIAAWQEFLKAVPMMARSYPDTHFVIRPHPAESAVPYEALARANGNVSVEGGYSIHPWLLSADAVVHHYCTSAVEAVAAGTRGFALRPERDPSIEKDIPYRCSTDCDSAESVVDAIGPVLADPRGARQTAKPVENYSGYVRNIDEPSAARTIVDEICRVAPVAPTLPEPSASARPRGAAQIGRMIRQLMPSSRSRDRYVTHKFDQLTIAEVREALGVFAGPDVSRFRCEPIADNVVSSSHENAS